MRTGNPLSVELGPGKLLLIFISNNFTTFSGILETIFDGIQRPLATIAELTNQNVFIPRGIELPNLDQDKLWDFQPLEGLSKGDLISGGDIIGTVFENSLF